MEIQSICDDIVGQKVIFIPFDPKKEFRYLLISIGQEQHICNLLYTKRIETGCIVSNSVLGAASTGTLVEFILFFNEADILPLELIEFEIEASFELFRILEKRKDLILLKLCDLFISNQKITINFMQKQISLKANLDKIGKITNETKISLIKIEKLSTIETFKMKSVEKASKNIKNQLNIFKKISKTKAIILHGAKGVGKTSLAMKIAKSQTHKYIKASSLISEKLGKTEQNLVDLFMTKNKILVIDDIEELLSPLLSQLLLELLKDQSICLLVIAITSRLDLIDPILISSAGFSNLHQLTLPQFSDRITLLKDLLAYEGSKSNIQSLSGLLETKDECLDSNIAVARQIEHISDESNNIEDLELFKQIAIETQGFSCSDMVNILQSTIPNELTLKNILTTSKITKPANLHGIQSQIPSITFKDLYGIDKITSKLKKMVIQPFQEIENYLNYRVKPPKGILIKGPSGNGKTMLAMALVNELGMSCIYVNSTNIRSKIVGKSEEAIKNLFTQAKSSAPCCLLIDQFEMLLMKRKRQTSEGGGDRIVTTFLTEMDGIFGGEGDIFIIGVTRDDKLIDEAVLRPGRLDIHIEVDLPNDEERSEMFRSVLEKMPTKIDDEQLLGLVEKTKEYTRGGIVDLCREAGMVCIRNGIDEVSINEFKI